MKIPKIIHQIWVGNENKRPAKLMQGWKENHPDYKFFEWNNKTVAECDFILRDQINQMFSVKRYHGVADLIRYEVLYNYGGFVAPADSECLNAIDDLLDLGFFACYENEEYNHELISPHLGTYPKNPFIGKIIDELILKENVLAKEPWRETGNLFLTEMIKKYKNTEIKILPSYTFIPEHRTGRIYKGKGKIYAKHYWGTTKNLYNKLSK